MLGIPVYYADDAARRLMNTQPELREAIINAFGKGAYQGKHLNRAYIASIVFGDNEKLQLLNSLTHPATIRDANEWMQQQSTPYIIKEAALIFESGSNEHLDLVVGVSSPLELRINRVISRDNVTPEVVRSRMARQMDEEIKMKLCDYVLVNDEKHLLIPQVLELHQTFKGKMAG